MTAKVSVQYAILCDDIRREDGGKLIVIGIYESGIIVHESPANFQLAVLLGLKILEIGDTGFDVQITADGAVQREVYGHLEIKKMGTTMVPIPPVPVLDLEGPCEISVRWRQGKQDEWKTALTIPLTITAKQPSRANA